MYENFEYVANEVTKMNAKVGHPIPVALIHPTTTRYKACVCVNTSTENSMIAWQRSTTPISRHIIPPFGIHVVRIQRITPHEPGVYAIKAQLKAYLRDIEAVKTVLVEEDPILVEEIRWNRSGDQLPVHPCHQNTRALSKKECKCI